MSKKLISIRIDENLVKEMDSRCRNHNRRSNFLTTSVRNYYAAYLGGYLSRADVVESALKLLFEQKAN